MDQEGLALRSWLIEKKRTGLSLASRSAFCSCRASSHSSRISDNKPRMPPPSRDRIRYAGLVPICLLLGRKRKNQLSRHLPCFSAFAGLGHARISPKGAELAVNRLDLYAEKARLGPENHAEKTSTGVDAQRRKGET